MFLTSGLGSVLALFLAAAQSTPNSVTWEGEKGPGKGKHIVFVAGDHEYRGEETLPALARIMARRYGFKCTFVVTTHPEDGTIDPTSGHIAGLEVLKSADLMVVFLRFQDWKDDQMQHFVDYLNTGKPVMGLRTSTHAFKMKDRKKKFAWLGNFHKGEDYVGGFGEQVLGENWVGHYGRNHRQSSRLILDEEAKDHPVLVGVKNPHTQCGGYKAYPAEGSVILARGRILHGMKSTDSPDKKKKELPVAWVRRYKGPASGKEGRVFTTTHGASEDILNEGFRRMLINAHLWCLGMEKEIKPDNPVAFVGPYNPVTYRFGGFRLGVKPADLAGWDSPIYSKEAPIGKKK